METEGVIADPPSSLRATVNVVDVGVDATVYCPFARFNVPVVLEKFVTVVSGNDRKIAFAVATKLWFPDVVNVAVELPLVICMFVNRMLP